MCSLLYYGTTQTTPMTCICTLSFERHIIYSPIMCYRCDLKVATLVHSLVFLLTGFFMVLSHLIEFKKNHGRAPGLLSLTAERSGAECSR